MGSETGITSSYYILSNYMEKSNLRLYNALIFITCTVASAGNLYIGPKLWKITNSLNWTIAVSEIANLISILCFLIFWKFNDNIRKPVNMDLNYGTEINSIYDEKTEKSTIRSRNHSELLNKLTIPKNISEPLNKLIVTKNENISENLNKLLTKKNFDPEQADSKNISVKLDEFDSRDFHINEQLLNPSDCSDQQ